MGRKNRKELAKKIANDIRRAIDNNRFKINGRSYLLPFDGAQRSQGILEELRKKGYSSAYEILKKVLLETRTAKPMSKRNLRQKQFPASANNYLFCG